MKNISRMCRNRLSGCDPVRSIAVFSLCYIVYFAVLEAFMAVPLFNQDIQVRPASALGPVMGLFFSWPGILGASCGNLLSDCLHYGSDPSEVAVYFGIQLVYNAVPYLAWYLLRARSRAPFPSIDSASKLGSYLAIVLADSVLVAALLAPFEPDVLSAMNIHVAHALNNFIFLVYLGIPLLIALDASPFAPISPRSVRVPYFQRGRVNLSQRFTMGFTAVLGITVAIFIGVSYSPFLVGFDSDFAAVVASIYVQASLLTLAAFVPLIALLGWMEHGITRPLDRLIGQSGEFARALASPEGLAGAGGVLDRESFRDLSPSPEMADLVDSVCLMRGELGDYVERLEAATAERERTAAELDIARGIQMGAVPHDFSTSSVRHRVLIEGFMRPAREVGGDFYDVFDASAGKVAFVIGDVSGKGVPAALFMMRAQSLLRERILSCDDLGEALSQVNDSLCDRNEAMLFVTVFACVLDSSTGNVRFANAGHNPPVLLQGGERSFLKVRPGLVLGAMEGMRYREGSLDLAMGDGLLLYTDGVTEATDPGMELFGEERLMAILRECDAERRPFAAKRIEAGIDAFAGECPQADDITVLSFCRSEHVADMQQIDLSPHEDELEVLFSFLGDLCDREGCTPKMLASLMLVAEELFVNICRYGFADGRPEKPVGILAEMDDVRRVMRLEFSDAGAPYNPLGHEPKKADANDWERLGGLGLLLVRRNVDEMEYEYIDGRNVLRLEKGYI